MSIIAMYDIVPASVATLGVVLALIIDRRRRRPG